MDRVALEEMSIRELRHLSGRSIKKMACELRVPFRTLHQWELFDRTFMWFEEVLDYTISADVLIHIKELIAKGCVIVFK